MSVGDPVLLETLRRADFHKDVSPHYIGQGRRYLPTLSDLVDRLAIVQLKAIFISEHRDEYMKERADIEHDIDLILSEGSKKITAVDIHAIMVIMLSNRFIWENEAWIRKGVDEGNLSTEQIVERYQRLVGTHSINGVRNAAKNQLSRLAGGRHDYKVDCLAADLPKEFGDWNVFE